MKAPRRAVLPAGPCWEVQRENQTVTALRGITSHSWTVCFGPSSLSGARAPNEAQPGVWEAAVISSLHLLADVGAEGDVRPLKGAVPHCRARASPSQRAQGFQGVCTSPCCAERCFQPVSSSHQQQLPTSGASIGQEPVQLPAGTENWGRSQPQPRSSRGKGKPGSLESPGWRAGDCKHPELSQAQTPSCWAPKPPPAAPCPQAAVLKGCEDFLSAQSQEQNTRHWQPRGRSYPETAAFPRLSCPACPWFPAGNVGRLLPALLVCGHGPKLIQLCPARVCCATAESHSLAFPSALENPVTDSIHHSCCTHRECHRIPAPFSKGRLLAGLGFIVTTN